MSDGTGARDRSGTAQGVFARTFAALDDVFTFTEGFFEHAGILGDDRFAVNFAVEEIFTNMVKYSPGTARPIVVRLARDGPRVVVTLIDRGADPFDPNDVPDARTDLPLEERRAGGLGLHLTRRLMDRVDYAHDGGANTITMSRELVASDV